MCKYIVQIIYFPSIFSLLFVLSHAKLKETNKKSSIMHQWINVNECVGVNVLFGNVLLTFNVVINV